MADALVEQLRPLGFEKYASRPTRIVGRLSWAEIKCGKT